MRQKFTRFLFLRKCFGSRSKAQAFSILAFYGSTLLALDGLLLAAPAFSTESYSLGFAKDDAEVEQLDSFDRYIRAKQYTEVEPLLLDYLKLYPNSWRAYYQLGYAYFSLHKTADSIKALSKSLELHIDNAEAHKVLGLNLTVVERYDLAQTEFEQAARLKPDSAEIHYFLGRVYYTKGVYPQAQKHFELALRLDASYMKAYDNLGLTFEALGDNAAALNCFQKAVELSEQRKLNSEWPYINLSSFYNRRNQSESALSYAQKAVQLNSQAAPAYFQIAKAYQSRGDWEEATKALTKAIEISPTTPDFYYVLSSVYKQMGKLKESQDAMKAFQGLQQNSTTEVYMKGRGDVSPVKSPEPEPSEQ
jgi:tetratricopeptide (TPR) repeat protein